MSNPKNYERFTGLGFSLGGEALPVESPRDPAEVQAVASVLHALYRPIRRAVEKVRTITRRR